MANTTKNVFISHIHEDDAGLGDLKNLLKKHGMDIRDGSVNSENPNNAKSPDYIKSQILAPKIDWASTMIVYITPETKDSEWVNWEIERAFQKDKTIVGVWEQGSNGCEIPDALKKYGDAVVGWDGGHIIDAVNGDYRGFNNPDGTPSVPQPIKRHACS
ncbi:TIR domain-containing protein [Shimia sp. R9_3]|uniref:TIR domain-containing protein n=1 Tax=Shimia sp. R9_3 TaxID=2821113 RepID=UPI001ADB4403|nr:TIR domain-containing protein [Shimia sp. R9_3]MBO9400526.1 TIR domain-containing protein [Shimia sp. R9_3]